MKSKIIHFAFLISAMSFLFYPTENLAQRKNNKSSQQKVAVPLEEWTPEPNSTFYKLITALPKIDKVELYSFRRKSFFHEDAPPPATIKAIPPEVIKQFSLPVEIISSKTLDGAAAKSFASIWRKLMRGDGMGCLAPGYRVKYYAKNQFILESDLCFSCHNLILKTNESGKGEIWGFNVTGKSGKKLLAKLQEFLPEK